MAAPAIPLLSMILSDLTMIEENDNSIDIKDSACYSYLRYLQIGVHFSLTGVALIGRPKCDDRGGSGQQHGGEADPL